MTLFNVKRSVCFEVLFLGSRKRNKLRLLKNFQYFKFSVNAPLTSSFEVS